MFDDVERRQLARSRLPAWLLILKPAVFLSIVLSGFVGLLKGAEHLHRALHPNAAPFFASDDPMTLAQGVIAVASFLAAAVAAVLIGNIVLWLIPPARAVLERNAAVSGLPFGEAMREMWGVASWALAALAAVLLLGIWAPWLPA